MKTDLEDDWESIEIPDLLVSIQNKENQMKLLEERKLMEEAEVILNDELFNSQQDKNKTDSQLISVKLKKEKPIKEKKRKEAEEKQKLKEYKKREMIEKQTKQKELYGEAELDIYDEMYGHIEEKY